MEARFGTSGLRGPVSDLTDDLVAAYVRAFLTCCATGERILIGRDLRRSSSHLSDVVAAAVTGFGHEVIDCGPIPTPALALAAMSGRSGAIMITGSHNPGDQNGLKFFSRQGEITKHDEARIADKVRSAPDARFRPPAFNTALAAPDASQAYRDRYLAAFGPTALVGLRIGVYEQSSVARDILSDILQSLGAEVVRFGRREGFMPLDTEALTQEVRRCFRTRASAMDLDAILSTDADGDRPLLADGQGRPIPGDMLGLLTARLLGAEIAVVPVSCNSALEDADDMRVRRCRIGSPHVIAAMRSETQAYPDARIVGFEANGGFILGFRAELPAGILHPLWTRDALLPLIATLVLACRGNGLPALLETLPNWHSASDRLPRIDPVRAAALLLRIEADHQLQTRLLGGPVVSVEHTDGPRMTMAGGTIIHLRLSGNAPELRCYAEDSTLSSARGLVDSVLQNCARALRSEGVSS